MLLSVSLARHNRNNIVHVLQHAFSDRGVDINPLAAQATARTLKANKVNTGDAISDNLVRPELVCRDNFILFH